ncbi:MAG TPA: hypothetical protein VNF02_06595 [Candidatus Limnocylindrales bacterium]|nr:hypothetical protein [Candidatus Limnocylindrales bacterium]
MTEKTVTYDFLIANEFHLHGAPETLLAASLQHRFRNLRYNGEIERNRVHKGDLP